MKLEEFNYDLPKELIAQEPAEPRDSCRLMMLDKNTGEWEHHGFRDILNEIRKGDIFVFNNTKVIPARLYGKKKDTGGKVEMLLLTPKGNDVLSTREEKHFLERKLNFPMTVTARSLTRQNSADAL